MELPPVGLNQEMPRDFCCSRFPAMKKKKMETKTLKVQQEMQNKVRTS